MAINLVTKYSPVVLERFAKQSVTEGFFNRDYDSEFIGAKTVKIHSIDVVEMGDYTRSGANRYGTPEELGDTVQELTIEQDKAFTYTIDRGNNIQQNFIKEAGRTLQRQVDEVVVPMVDTYRFSVMAAKADVGNKVDVDLAADSVYLKLLDVQELLDDATIPEVGRVLWATPKFIKELKKDDNFVLPTDAGQAIKFRGYQGEIDGIPVIKTPTSRMPSKTLGILAHTSALLSPLQLSEYHIHENAPGISGHLVEGRLIYDTFVLENREKAVAVFTDTTV